MSVGSMGSIHQQQFVPAAVLFGGASDECFTTPQEGMGFGANRAPESIHETGSAKAVAAARSATDALLIEHLPTVRYVARRIYERLPQHVDFEELVSAGVVGLIDAALKFKDEKNTQFKTYAQFRIRGAILDSLRSLDWSPRELRRKGRSVEEAIRTQTQRCGRTPSDVEVAAEMSLTLQEYQRLLTELKGLEIGSLNVERNEESGEEELAYVAAPADESPLFRCLQAEMKQHLMDAIDNLPERERMVLTLYYYEELSMKEIGQLMGVVESRVSQIKRSAVVRVRAAMSASAPAAKEKGAVRVS